ncbi:MAG: ABC transporter permease, partial [Candidatus Dormibacteraceae bacterium]
MLAGVSLLALALIAVAAPILAPHNPVRENLIVSMLPPAWEHAGNHGYLLGTDAFGRDVLSRLIYGAR